jgi:hypothetical protein
MRRAAAALILVMGMGAFAPMAHAQIGAAINAERRLAQVQQKQKQKQKAPPLPGRAIQRFLAMSPEQRERALAQLPPERRELIEQRLRRLEKLTPTQVETLIRNFEIFQGLPPRRQVVLRQALQRLRNMPEARRKETVESDAIKALFSPLELQLLRDSAGLPDLDEEQ